MSNLSFSLELAQQLYRSTEPFPISFDDAWIWLGYSKKDKALKTLKSNFMEGEDFALLQEGEWTQGGRSSDLYGMTVDCFKSLGMMAGTEKGRQVRKYFIECERLAKSAPISQPQSTAEMLVLFAQQALEQERRTKALEAKLAQIEAAQQDAIASLDETPTPEVEAEELTTRSKLNRLVRDYSAANAVHFQEIWRRVYREFRDRYHIDLRQRVKNIQSAGGKAGALDICEQLGKLEELYAVAFDLLRAR